MARMRFFLPFATPRNKAQHPVFSLLVPIPTKRAAIGWSSCLSFKPKSQASCLSFPPTHIQSISNILNAISYTSSSLCPQGHHGHPQVSPYISHGEKRRWQEAGTFTQPQRHWFLTLSGHDLDSWGPFSQKTTHLDVHSKFCVQSQLHSGHLCSPTRVPVQESLVLCLTFCCPHLEILNLFWPRHVACGILVPQPGIQPKP